MEILKYDIATMLSASFYTDILVNNYKVNNIAMCPLLHYYCVCIDIFLCIFLTHD